MKKCLESEDVFTCNKARYCENTVAFELGYLQGMGKAIKQIEPFKEKWLNEVINHFNSYNRNYRIKK